MCEFKASPKKEDRIYEESRESANHDDGAWEQGRTPFIVDRDRILYSLAFRRLKGKTQVYLAKMEDHIRNRLTHTIEVAQIAEALARSLNLNRDLAVAASYGHDLGHTPFGHVGERALHDISVNGISIDANGKNVIIKSEKEQSGFHHAYQSLRIVQNLEPYHSLFGVNPSQNLEDNLEGMNLTKKVQWAMAVHTFPDDKDSFRNNLGIYNNNLKVIKNAFTAEAFVVTLADEIAQIHHDMVDSFLVRILDAEKLESQLEKVLEGLCQKYNPQNGNLKILKQEYEILTQELKTFKPRMDGIGEEKNAGKKKVKYTALFSGCILRVLHIAGCVEIRGILDELKQAAISINPPKCKPFSLADIQWRDDYAENVFSKIQKNRHSDKEKFNTSHSLGGTYSLFKLLVSENKLDPKKWRECKNLAEINKLIINSKSTRKMDSKGEMVLRDLVHCYVKYPRLCSDGILESTLQMWKKENGADYSFEKNNGERKKVEEHIEILDALEHIKKDKDKPVHSHEEKLLSIFLRAVIDHISGYTDNYALEKYATLHDAQKNVW